MGLFDDIKNSASNIWSNTTSSITGGWSDLTNINTLGLPNIDLSNLFRTVSGLPNALSGAGTNDTVQKEPLKGIDAIWKHNNDYLTTVASSTDENSSKFVTDFMGGVDTDGPDRKNSDMYTIIPTDDADRLNFQTPDWTYADFINERAIFQKSLQNPLGEKGWFYFKIFFNFDTQYGLLGGLLNNPDPLMATNSAYRYLHSCESLGKYYKCNDRQVALLKFAKILSYISTYAPWFFKGIKNVNQANVPIINDLTKERSIEIECSEDAVDMRLNTLLDLYKFACYDEIDQKEIVPDNLRKFDMTVMLFQAPLRYYHTSFITKDGHKYNYKGTNVNSKTGFADTMSFKMYTFINCEIDIESLGNMVPGTMNNEKPFTMGGGNIKIMYDRVYSHTMNEFMHIMFGNDGLYYDGSGSSKNSHSGATKEKYENQSAYQRQRIADIAKIHEEYNPDHPNNPLKFKAVIDASEALCTNNMLELGFNALGNFFSGTANDPQIVRSKNGTSLTDYYKLKRELLNNKINLQQLLSVTSPGNGLVTDLIETYNKTQGTIKATWHSPDNEVSKKRIYTKNGFIMNDTQEKTAANMYWMRKLAQMNDGISSPETLVERLDTQRYIYNNFTNKGYGDKLLGTPYWKEKIRELNDGRIKLGDSVYNTTK